MELCAKPGDSHLKMIIQLFFQKSILFVSNDATKSDLLYKQEHFACFKLVQ